MDVVLDFGNQGVAHVPVGGLRCLLVGGVQLILDAGYDALKLVYAVLGLIGQLGDLLGVLGVDDGEESQEHQVLHDDAAATEVRGRA